MATTNLHHATPPHQRAYNPREERSSYAAVLIIIALAVLAAVAYGYYTTDPDTIDQMPMTQAQQSTMTPATNGSTSTMSGTSTVSPALTPSVVTPGSPDTTTTESSNIPADGIN